jgi:hypothetical protein
VSDALADLRRLQPLDVFERLDRGDLEAGSWLMRAWDRLPDDQNASGGGRWLKAVPAPFLEMVEAEMAKAIAAIEADLAEVEVQGGRRVVLWRGLTRPPDDDRPAGVHWSPLPEAARTHGRHLVRAEIPTDRIDWIETLVRRISWPLEREVSLKPDSACERDAPAPG